MKRFLLTALVSFLIFSSTTAQTPWPDSTALESYMDGLVNTYMEENDIAGATVGIVKDGKPILLKGYGLADVENDKKIDPDSTLFRIGSISKMFVWTAVMQLAEEDKLELDADINQYLRDFQIPETYDDPITLRDLMTHSAGFEEYFLGLFARDTTRLKPLGEILADELPARVRPPGVHASYSNHGTGIAAYIVEKASGMPFEDYVEERIFKPLDMDQSTFRQPVPQHLRSHLSKGYAFKGGEFAEKDFEYIPLGPVGAASTTAEDMLHFMQAHLQYGQFKDAAILDTATAQLMQRPAFRHAQSVNPMRYGFIDHSQNGVEIIGHGGDTIWFHSTMRLFPEHNLGFFLSFNSAKGGSTRGKLFSDFVDHYFPKRETNVDTLQLSKEELKRFAGSYRANRYPHKRFTYLVALFGSNEVSVTEDSTLKTMDEGEAHFWFPVDSLTFRNTRNSEVIAFNANSEGQVTHMYRKDLPIMAFEKVPLISSQKLHYTLFGLAGGAFLLTLIYWPLAYGIRREYRPIMTARNPISFLKKVTAWFNALIMLAFFLSLSILLSGNGEAIIYGVTTGLKVALVLPLISVILTGLMIYHTYSIWQKNESGVWSRIWYTLLTLVSITLLWQFYYWNLLGFQY